MDVECANSERECTWVGALETLEKHVATCDFTLLRCPLKCKVGNVKQYFIRRDLDDHMEMDCPNRDHECPHCGEEGTYVHITEVHDLKCDEKKIPCPNAKCTKTMKRQRMEKHVADICSYTVIPCKYEMIGCDKEMERVQMKLHEKKANLHLQIAIDSTLELKKEIALKKNERLIFKLDDYEYAKGRKKEFESPSFYSHPEGYEMQIDVYANGRNDSKGTHVAVYAYILEDDDLWGPFVGRVTITLLNQMEDKNHHTSHIVYAEDSKHCEGIDHFIAHSKLGHDPIKNTQYLMDDTLYFKVSVEVADHKPWLTCTPK